MDETRIVLSGIWVALMLTYLLGDVLRIFAGGITPGEISGKQVSQGAWLGMAVLMLIPIVMVVLTLILTFPTIRWVNLVAAIFLVIFNLFGLPYRFVFDNFLIIVGIAFNGLTVWYAWTWAA